MPTIHAAVLNEDHDEENTPAELVFHTDDDVTEPGWVATCEQSPRQRSQEQLHLQDKESKHLARAHFVWTPEGERLEGITGFSARKSF